MIKPKRQHSLFTTMTIGKTASAGRVAGRWGSALLLALLLAFAPALPVKAAQTDATQQRSLEQDKIDFLIDSVATLKGASFIRNGTAYDASQAAFHMRLKLRFAGRRVKTAQDFIVYCGSKSSTSGIPYTIRFADGHSVDSEIFLRHRLAEYKAETPMPDRNMAH